MSHAEEVPDDPMGDPFRHPKGLGTGAEAWFN